MITVAMVAVMLKVGFKHVRAGQVNLEEATHQRIGVSGVDALRTPRSIAVCCLGCLDSCPVLLFMLGR